jgi:hypothetical protein
MAVCLSVMFVVILVVHSVSLAPFRLGYYLFYLLTLTIPCWVFVAGLMVFLSSYVSRLMALLAGILWCLGGFWLLPYVGHGTFDFFGVGIGVQLPVFNRNKGAIRSARFRLRQNEILVLQERNNIRNEIIECLENYKAVYSFLEENGVNRSIQSEMDKMPDVYTKNLLMKNISMVEYMDFMDSYHASKEVLLRSRKELRLQFERLQFAIGQTIK